MIRDLHDLRVLRVGSIVLASAAAPLAPFVAPASWSSCAAQERPAEVARTLFDALERRDWAGAAAVLDPTVLSAIRAEYLTIFLSSAQQAEERRGTRGGVRGMSGMTLNLREDELDTVALAAHARVDELVGRPTLGEVAALPPVQLLARLIEATQRMGGWRSLGSGTRRVVGEVVESDTVAHVLYRTVAPPDTAPDRPRWRRPPDQAEIADVRVLTLRRVAGAWRPLVNEDLVFWPSMAMASHVGERE